MLDRTRHNPPPQRRGRAPKGYEMYAVNWASLTPAQVEIVCSMADALREIRWNELELLRLGTVYPLQLLLDELRELNAEMRAERLLQHQR